MKLIKYKKGSNYKDIVLFGLIGISVESGLFGTRKDKYSIRFNTYSSGFFSLKRFERFVVILLNDKRIVIEF